ncbi:MAG: hypothetical protein GTO14_20580 [Anaerolineales bacterium]|nr:hypothetical protein [Anaerolineales bacterium]
MHEKTLRSLEQAASERGLEHDQIVRTLVFRLENGEFILMLMPGPRKVAWPKLRRHLGVSRLTTADAEEVFQVTGYETGAVSPFGLKNPLRILADRRIMDYDVLSIGAGMRNAGILLKRDDLVKNLNMELGDFGE